MKRKCLLLLVVFLLAGCFNAKSNDAAKFKETYESLNGKKSDEHTYREVSIPLDNPIKISSFEEVNEMYDNGETFYAYFGFESCPWCRSIVEKLIEIAKKNNVKTIYYVDVRPGEDSYETDIRDEYAIDKKGKIYLDREGSEGYHEFLKRFDNVLNDYSRGDIKSLDGTKYEGAKRLGAPNIIYVKNGKSKKLVSGISKRQEDGFQELSEKILKDEEKIFEEFFN